LIEQNILLIMQQGYTITPDGYEDQVTGQMVFTDYKVVGSAPGEEARTNEVVEHQGRFLDNEDGSTTYVNEATDEDYSNILSSYGGEEVIADAEDWAQRHFSQDEIDYYNQVLERGDLNEIQEAVDFVWNAYQARNEDAEPAQEEVASASEDEQWVYDNVMNESDYQKLINRGAEVLDHETIRLFNDVIDGGNREQIANAIRLLQQRVNQN
jgi:hypothetical protein